MINSNRSIDFDSQYQYYKEKSRSTIAVWNHILIWLLAFTLVLFMDGMEYNGIQLWIVTLIMWIMVFLTRFIIQKCANAYFNTRVAQTFKYAINNSRRELYEKVAPIAMKEPQVVDIGDIVALRRNVGQALFEKLNLSCDTNTKDYLNQLIDIEVSICETFENNVSTMNKFVLPFIFQRLENELKLKPKSMSAIFPIYTFESKNKYDVVIDKLDVVLNVTTLRKMVDHIDSQINMSYRIQSRGF